MNYKLNTTVCGDGKIIQELFNSSMKLLTKEILDTRQESVVKALIALGWTPPERITGASPVPPPLTLEPNTIK